MKTCPRSYTLLDLLTTADGLDREANLPELLRIDDQSAIEDKGGFVHALVYRLPVNLTELLPFRGDDDSFGVLASIKSRGRDGYLLFD